MADAEDKNNKRVTAGSVAGFMLMPQIRLSFQHFGFVMPVFIRTIAAMFVSADLLPQDHPATRYGAEGVKRYGFMELMRESWAHLRTMPHATPYQWGLFSSVVMMTVCIVIGAIIYAFSLTGLLVGSATAQIFDSPTTGGAMGAYGGGMFNKVKGTGEHADYGRMIIDKLFREGADGVGGPLQNAVRGLMDIYNTGVLVVAGVMLFWIIISVVVDTARTGQIGGGGRHNMVWAPIRIVFALGLLIPLGSTVGYSSGQFAVMKLAEYGSNFGTRAWLKYVDGILSVDNLTIPANPKNMTDLVKSYTGMWLCRVAYNGVQNVTMGDANVPAEQKIMMYNLSGTQDDGKASFQFTNKTAANICGTVTYDTGTDSAMSYAMGGVMSGSPDQAADSVAIAQASVQYKKEVMQAYAGLVVPGLFGSSLEGTAKKFACAFASQIAPLYPATSGGPSPLQTECGGDGGNQCGAGPAGSGQMPDMSCVTSMVNTAYNQVNSQMQSSYTNLQNTVYQHMLAGLKEEGWAGMGRWYQQISTLNETIMSVSKPSISITSGVASSVTNSSEHANDVRGITARYNTWWQTVPQMSSASIGGPAGSGGTTAGNTVSPSAVNADMKSMVGGDDTGAMNFDKASSDKIVNMLFSGLDQGYFLFDVASPSDPNTYPLSQLARNGNELVLLGTVMISIVTVLQAALGLLDLHIEVEALTFGGGFSLGNLGKAIADSFLFEMMTTMGQMILAAGLLLSIYVPMIPFLRTLFAVVTWMMAIFEAIMMVPIAALAHLTTQGEGLAGNGRNAWIVWLNVLMRPTLTVIGYVGALLAFNTFVLYFHDIFTRLTITNLSHDGLAGLFAIVSNTIIYVFVMYTAANMCFKLLDIIPSALMKYMGGSADHSFDNEATAGAISQYGQGMASSYKGAVGRVQGKMEKDRENQREKNRSGDPGANNST